MQEAADFKKQILIKKIDTNTLNIRIFDNKMLMAIVGEFNTNLAEIENLTNTRIFFRGNSITIKGDQNSISEASESLKYLANKFQITNSIENSDIIYSINNKMSTVEEKNKSNVRPLGQIIKTPKKSVVPRSKNNQSI